MKKLLLLLAAACCIASCAEIRTTYIGKAYPTTGTAPELYFDWKDVPSDYETMGSIKATPSGKTLEEAQAHIEQIGREKGADAIVFEGVVSETSAPTSTMLTPMIGARPASRTGPRPSGVRAPTARTSGRDCPSAARASPTSPTPTSCSGTRALAPIATPGSRARRAGCARSGWRR